ncbi:MAG TPA: hypothetical protein ENJ44_01360, partial [Oceanospirillales bacterium]|nr:hypothetical protein [Oceanospirillales bacterium]
MTLYKKNLKQLFPALFLIVTTLFYYIPSLVYFSNRKDFSDTFFVMILPVLAVVVIIAVIFWLILALIPHKIMKYFSAILLTAAVLLWLQGDYFVTNYGVLDGSKIYFEQFKQRGFYELAIVSVVFALSIFMQKFINKQLPFIVLLIAIGQIGIVTYNAINEANDKKTSKQIDDEFFNYSSKKNVILVILDAFGADYFEKIRQENPAVVDDLDGFVNYTDAISNYPVTHGSVPSLLTGKMVPDDVHYRHYLRHIVPKTDLPILLEKQGYLVSVISVYTWFDVLYKKMYLTEPVIDNAILKKYYALYLYDMAIFRAVPHFLKRFIYNNGSWRLSDTLANLSHIPSLRPEKARFMLDLVTNKMKKTTAQKRFKMVHVVLPHPEYVYDENCDKIGSILNIPETKLMLEQSKCAFKKLKQYLNKLKALNIYDSSLIVVVSDHGARVISDRSVNGFPSYFAMAGSAALFMVKGINQKGHF